ncbi:hypothetical protein NKR23_g11900 [Pleurostoma richardsiae]|uniref:Peptidase S1 domain-containing protein n=1 Tax=Pleurostoma richardsiae TaxID=41990 RepID=A0AA38R9H0_9PEZI|nr:hypothetical protein NKR23_g11900 [Pleurostoma richardsiae]
MNLNDLSILFGILCLTPKNSHVRRTDFAPDGKYRAICKLFLQFRKYEYVATGWLIDSSTVVTAGHNVYDWRDGYLVSVKAFTGYYGPKSEYDPKVDRRHGRCVILPYAWIAKEYENYDVALIALEKPFTISTSVKYTNTPETETKRYLGVVGYPTDLDNGDSMYEGFVETTYDLSKYGMMLAYQVDTMGGNSGSPVLRMNDDGLTMTAIGVHCYGDIAQALDWFFKSKAKCLTNHTVRSVTKDASVAVSQIHREILTAALTESFPSVEHKAIDRIIDLTKTIKTILGDKRQRPDELTAVNQRFWLMMTSYEHSNEEDGRTCAEIKIVSFHFTDSAVKTLAGKGGTEILNVRFGFNVDAFEFNNDRWMDVKDVIPGELVNKGHASINSANNSLEIQLANGDIS